jgi:hypothetical protein
MTTLPRSEYGFARGVCIGPEPLQRADVEAFIRSNTAPVSESRRPRHAGSWGDSCVGEGAVAAEMPVPVRRQGRPADPARPGLNVFGTREPAAANAGQARAQ